MRKKLITSILVFGFLVSCNNTKNKPLIEIYLPKDRIQSNDGIKITEDILNFPSDTSRAKYFKKQYNYIRLDTVNNRRIFAGSFDATKLDLQESPLIGNNDILGFDFETSRIKLSGKAVEQLSNLKPSFIMGKQFIITADKKPILTGYFRSSFSSYYISHFFIEYIHKSAYEVYHNKPEFTTSMEFEIFHNSQSKQVWDLKKFDFKTKSDFYNAFKERDGEIN